MRSWTAAEDAVRRLCAAGGPERALRAAVLREIRAVVPFDSYVWALTDPVTTVGAAPLAEIPALPDLPQVIRWKYLTATNRWTDLPAGGVATRAGCPALPHALARHGIVDVLSAVHRDRYGTWGFLDLWRRDGTFTPAETAFVAALGDPLARALRSAVAASVVPGGSAPAGPVVLTLTDELGARQQTPATDAQLRALLPTKPDQPPVPAVALNVAAQLLAVEAGVDAHPPAARLTHGDGRWVTARAARLDPATIAVTVERSTTAERVEVYARALGLTARETELVEHLVTGADTRGVARALGIAEHTVNDHLKSIFGKAGTNSRRQLVANATG